MEWANSFMKFLNIGTEAKKKYGLIITKSRKTDQKSLTKQINQNYLEPKSTLKGWIVCVMCTSILYLSHG